MGERRPTDLEGCRRGERLLFRVSKKVKGSFREVEDSEVLLMDMSPSRHEDLEPGQGEMKASRDVQSPNWELVW